MKNKKFLCPKSIGLIYDLKECEKCEDSEKCTNYLYEKDYLKKRMIEDETIY